MHLKSWAVCWSLKEIEFYSLQVSNKISHTTLPFGFQSKIKEISEVMNALHATCNHSMGGKNQLKTNYRNGPLKGEWTKDWIFSFKIDKAAAR